jgi:hypothetical protein
MDIGWVKQDANGVYVITSKGKMRIIEREKPMPDYRVPP